MQHSLRKTPEFHLISWCANFAEKHRFRIVSGESHNMQNSTTYIKPNMSYKRYIINIVNFLLHFFLEVFVHFTWDFAAFFKKVFSVCKWNCNQNKELLGHFRVHRKGATSAQTDRWISTDGPLCTGQIFSGQINLNYNKMIFRRLFSLICYSKITSVWTTRLSTDFDLSR